MKKYILILILVLSVLFIRYAGFGVSNHNEFLPIVYRGANETYLENDWFTDAADNINPRTNFANYVNHINNFFLINNMEATFLVLTILFVFVFALGFYNLSFLLTQSKGSSIVATLMILSIQGFGIGNGFTIGNFFNPGTVAWAFIIWSIYFFFDKNYALSFFLLGLAASVQLMSPVIVFGVLFITILLTVTQEEVVGIAKGMVWFPIVLIAFNYQLLKNLIFASFKLTSAQIVTIYSFRFSHHFFKVSIFNWLLFFGFIGLFMIAYKYTNIGEKRFFKNCFLVILGFIIVSFIFTQFIPLGLFYKLRLHRAIELLNIIQVIFIGNFIYKLIHKRKWIAIVIPILLVLPLLFSGYTGVYFEEAKHRITSSPIGRFEYPEIEQTLYSYIQNNTPEDAVFLIPSDMKNFRLGANRAVVVSWKAHPFGDEGIYEWYNRIENLKYKTIGELQDLYNFDYVVLRNERGYIVYEVK